jgi:hypothetical protein
MSVAPVLTPRGLAAGSEAKVSNFYAKRKNKKKKKKGHSPRREKARVLAKDI